MRVQYRRVQFIDPDAAIRSYFTVALGYVSKVPIPDHYHVEKVSICFCSANRDASHVLMQKSRQNEEIVGMRFTLVAVGACHVDKEEGNETHGSQSGWT
jgi:hypothetical protein